MVRIPNDEETYRELRLRLEPGHANEQYIICVECGTEYPSGAVKLLPVSPLLRFGLWPDDMEMFFCPTCDSYVPMSPPYTNEE